MVEGIKKKRLGKEIILILTRQERHAPSLFTEAPREGKGAQRKKKRCSGSYRQANNFLVIKNDSIFKRLI